jgi:hypothetical protein
MKTDLVIVEVLLADALAYLLENDLADAADHVGAALREVRAELGLEDDDAE